MNVNVSKRNLICVLTVALCCMIGYTAMFSLSIKKEMNEFIAEINHETAETQGLPSETVTIETDPGFTMIKHEEKIGIYAKDTYELLDVLDVFVITLPQADQDMLEHGIDVSSKRELISLIEDYTS